MNFVGHLMFLSSFFKCPMLSCFVFLVHVYILDPVVNACTVLDKCRLRKEWQISKS